MAVQNRLEHTSNELQRFHVNVRIKISALWAAMLFVFAYVDIFSLYRPDVRAQIEVGEIAGFAIGKGFLLATTVYVLLPSLMVFAALVLPARLNRLINIALSGIYALTIVAGAVGEWTYYVLGSGVEVVLLGLIAYYAATWPKMNSGQVQSEGETGVDRRGRPVNEPVARA